MNAKRTPVSLHPCRLEVHLGEMGVQIGEAGVQIDEAGVQIDEVDFRYFTGFESCVIQQASWTH